MTCTPALHLPSHARSLAEKWATCRSRCDGHALSPESNGRDRRLGVTRRIRHESQHGARIDCVRRQLATPETIGKRSQIEVAAPGRDARFGDLAAGRPTVAMSSEMDA